MTTTHRTPTWSRRRPTHQMVWTRSMAGDRGPVTMVLTITYSWDRRGIRVDDAWEIVDGNGLREFEVYREHVRVRDAGAAWEERSRTLEEQGWARLS